MRSADIKVGEIVLRANSRGCAGDTPVVFLHGGGQTRWAWAKAAEALTERGFHTIALDLRGHGESDWSPDGAYSLDLYTADVAALCATLPVPPVLVGASLGGLVGMCLSAATPPAIAGLVLVDILPEVPNEGAEHVRAFMAAAPDGFESLEEASEAVSRYLPHRRRPYDSAGLRKNLRLRDGRYYWHWDPAMLNASGEDRAALAERLYTALASTEIPLLLVRGSLSRIVTEAGAAAFAHRVPRAEMVVVAGADHMVAGDSNHPFTAAVLDFLDRHRGEIEEFQGIHRQAEKETSCN